MKLLLLTMGSCLLCSGLGLAQSRSAKASNEVQQHIDKVVGCLHEPVMAKGDPCVSLEDSMKALHVPGVSIAVVHDGKIEWARGFGVERIGGPPVTADTLFQAGSISKPVSAMAALRLVQEDKLSLDEDVNKELVTWKVPASPAANGVPVTLRELLTHTAGMTVHGFPGYARGAEVPTLVEVLNGQKPANTPAIVVESVPGSKFNYSGGGYTVMLQMVLDATKEPFAKFEHDTVLKPIGMSHSTYQQPLPADLEGDAATPYNADSSPVAGGAYTYPELTAAGLWTTPTDLARYEMEVQRSLAGKANHVLSQQMTKEMLTAGKGNWGLGLEIGGSTADPYFSHGGINTGFEGLFVAYENHGDGAAVMTNAQGGLRLATEVMQSIAVAYGWPDFLPVVRTEVKVDPAVLAQYVGSYAMSPKLSFSFTLEGDQLMVQAGHQEKLPLFPESASKFFLKAMNAEFEFVKDDKGQVSSVILHQGGHDVKATRK